MLRSEEKESAHSSLKAMLCLGPALKSIPPEKIKKFIKKFKKNDILVEKNANEPNQLKADS